MASSVSSLPRGESKASVAFRTAAIIVGPFIVIGLLFLGGRLIFGAIGDAVCADYNSLSNDFCDEWHYDTPPDDALPPIAGWSLAWHELFCGSAGCPDRMYVFESQSGGLEGYIAQLNRQGWSRHEDPRSRLLTYRKGNFKLGISNARTSHFRTLYPKRFRSHAHVVVSVSLIDD